MTFPITTVHQIEISSRCNLRCPYCPHPQLKRPKVDMDFGTYVNAISWAVELGGPELSFTGMGEALLHPEFVRYIDYARAWLPKTYFLLATNGIALMSKRDRQRVLDLLDALLIYDVAVFVSTHRPEVAGPALELCLKHGIRAGTNTAFVTSGFDWAGQVRWGGVAAPITECQYLAQGWATILVDGAVVNCCMDAHGLHPSGNVNDVVKPAHFAPIPLCGACHLTVPEERS